MKSASACAKSASACARSVSAVRNLLYLLQKSSSAFAKSVLAFAKSAIAFTSRLAFVTRLVISEPILLPITTLYYLSRKYNCFLIGLNFI